MSQKTTTTIKNDELCASSGSSGTVVFCREKEDPAIAPSFPGGCVLSVPAFCKFCWESIIFFLKGNINPLRCHRVIETEADKLKQEAFDNDPVS